MIEIKSTADLIVYERSIDMQLNTLKSQISTLKEQRDLTVLNFYKDKVRETGKHSWECNNILIEQCETDHSENSEFELSTMCPRTKRFISYIGIEDSLPKAIERAINYKHPS